MHLEQAQSIKRKSIRFQIIYLVILCLGILAVLVPATPSYNALADRDSGVFLYIGKQVLNGAVPYRDVWDHKPPLVYFIDALGLCLGGGSRWGVVALEFVSLLSAFTLAFYFLRSLFGDTISALATLSALPFVQFYLKSGNLTEEYFLPLGFLAFVLWLIIERHAKKFKWWIPFLLGLAGGIAFQLKQTLIGIWLALVIYYVLKMIFSKDWRDIRILLWMAAGAVSPQILFIIYFAANHALAQYWNSAFIFNFIYAHNSQSTFLGNIVDTLKMVIATGALIIPVGFFMWLFLLPRMFQLLGNQFAGGFKKKWPGIVFLVVGIGGLIPILYTFGRTLDIHVLFKPINFLPALLGLGCISIGVAWLLGMLEKGFPKKDRQSGTSPQPADILWIILLIDWVIEICLISFSGKTYSHYFYSIMPVSIILFAEFIYYLKKIIQRSGQIWFFWSLIVTLCIAIFFTGVRQILSTLSSKPLDRTSLAVYLDEVTTKQETVLIWGNQLDYLFLANRNSPGRFIYQYPLYYSQYVTSSMVTDFLVNLKSAPPILVIDTKTTSAPFIRYDETGKCIFPASWELDNFETPVPAELSSLFQYFCDHYKIIAYSSLHWPIYQYHTTP
jgi:hypothetical protein